MLTDKAKRNIVKQYLRTIHSISDKEYQRRAWIRGEPPGIDFDEFIYKE